MCVRLDITTPTLQQDLQVQGSRYYSNPGMIKIRIKPFANFQGRQFNSQQQVARCIQTRCVGTGRGNTKPSSKLV